MKITRFSFLSALALLAIATLPQAAQAQAPAFSPSNNNNLLASAGTAGYTFTVGASAISVTDLGFWDYLQNGLQQSHAVTIWNGSGTQLATGIVPSGTAGTLTGEYRYVTLGSPITLSANTTYTIGANLGSADFSRAFLGNGDVTAASGVSLGDPRSISTENTFPTSDEGGMGHYMTPNFKFSIAPAAAAPEPGTLALLALGGTLVILKRRRTSPRH